MRMPAALASLLLIWCLGCSGGKGPSGNPAIREQRATNLVVHAAAGDFASA